MERSPTTVTLKLTTPQMSSTAGGGIRHQLMNNHRWKERQYVSSTSPVSHCRVRNTYFYSDDHKLRCDQRWSQRFFTHRSKIKSASESGLTRNWIPGDVLFGPNFCAEVHVDTSIIVRGQSHMCYKELNALFSVCWGEACMIKAAASGWSWDVPLWTNRPCSHPQGGISNHKLMITRRTL